MSSTVIPEIPVFQGLNLLEREELNEWIERREYEAGTMVIKEGAPEDGLYILAKGRASVLKKSRYGQVQVGEVEGPTVVGELGLLTKESRSASVRAETPVIVAFMSAEKFEEKIRQRNTIAYRISYNLGRLASLRLRSVLGRLVELSEACSAEALKHDGASKRITRKLEDLSMHIIHEKTTDPATT